MDTEVGCREVGRRGWTEVGRKRLDAEVGHRGWTQRLDAEVGWVGQEVGHRGWTQRLDTEVG